MLSVKAEDIRIVLDISLTLSRGCELLKITERMCGQIIVIVNYLDVIKS